jgi:repressor LexA
LLLLLKVIHEKEFRVALQDSYAGVAYENRRSKSPELMSEIKKYIEDYYLQNRQSPSTTKIAEAVGIARGTAYKYLVEMAEKNMIEYDGQEIRTNVTRKYSGGQTQTPIVGSIPCGSPQYEEENIEEYVSLPTAISAKEISSY